MKREAYKKAKIIDEQINETLNDIEQVRKDYQKLKSDLNQKHKWLFNVAYEALEYKLNSLEKQFDAL